MSKSLKIPSAISLIYLSGLLLTNIFPVHAQSDSTILNGKNKIKVSVQDSSVSPIGKIEPTKTEKSKKTKPDFKYHSPVKATWMSAALPSLGQFYNKRYWKPPIIYVGIGVSLYFLIDNQQKFIIARNSYRARLGVPGFTLDSKYQNFSADQILSDRDFYRTNRDYSIIGVGLVYVLNIVDAAVDAHLRTFDVSDDLSMKIRPSLQWVAQNRLENIHPTTGMKLNFTF